MIKTKEEVVQEVKDKMRELHGRVYVYTIEDVWTKQPAPIYFVGGVECLVKYRKGYFYINAEWSKDEVRDRRLNELGL